MKINLIIVSAILLMTSIAQAGFEHGSQSITLQLGGSVTNNEFNWQSHGGKNAKAADKGGAFGVQYLYYLQRKPAVAVGLDFSHYSLDYHEETDTFPNLNSRSRFQPTTIVPMARVGVSDGTFRPYLFGGLGIHSTSLFLELTPVSGTTWADTATRESRVVVDGTAAAIAANFGFGLDVFMTQSTFIGLEFRFNYLARADYGVTSAGENLGFTPAEGDLSNSAGFIRFGYKFGE